MADRFTHNVYDAYAAGETGILKAKTTDFDRIFVLRSTDGGRSWTAALVFHAPTPVGLDNVFPTLAVDPTSITLLSISLPIGYGFRKLAGHGVEWQAMAAKY